MKRIGILCLIGVVSLLGLLQFRLVAADPPSREQSSTEQSPPEPVERAPLDEKTTAGNAPPADLVPNSFDAVPSANGVEVVDFTNNLQEQPPARPAPSTAAQEAIIDVGNVFKHYHRFQQRSDALKAKVREAELALKEKRALIFELREQLKSAQAGETANALRKAQDVLRAEINVATGSSQRELLLAEAKMYHTSYEEMREVVARYAKQHGIRTVRKANTVVGEAREVDLNDRQALLERINREIVYSEPQYIDITDAIIEQLNKASPASND